MNQVVNIDEGNLVVCSSLSGNLDNYTSARVEYNKLRKKGPAYLVLAGDSIHAPLKKEDDSIVILNDLINHPDPNVIALMGRDELSHVYSLPFSDEMEAGKSLKMLEKEMGNERRKYIQFMANMPYAVRTKGGVTINHSGASSMVSNLGGFFYLSLSGGMKPLEFLNNLNHQEDLGYLKLRAKVFLEERTGELPESFFDGYSPVLGNMFIHSNGGAYIADLFFNMNEETYGKDYYPAILDSFLKNMSEGYAPQKFLISGKTTPDGSCDTFLNKQLRINSGEGPGDSEGVMSLVDASHQYECLDEVVEGLVPL